MENLRRGYIPQDSRDFSEEHRPHMEAAAQEIYYLINRGYAIKSAATFVGNHYLLSERQRLALARMLSPQEKLLARKEKQVAVSSLSGTVHMDGFNTIITLEVAGSGSLLLQGMDQTIRDLAGLRGTYRLSDKTERAIEILLQSLSDLGAAKAVIYLDKPVSNSGRLSLFIQEKQKQYPIEVEVQVINDVDRNLYNKEQVITTDAIILDQCVSWVNLNAYLIPRFYTKAWIYQLLLEQSV